MVFCRILLWEALLSSSITRIGFLGRVVFVGSDFSDPDYTISSSFGTSFLLELLSLYVTWCFPLTASYIVSLLCILDIEYGMMWGGYFLV